MVTLYPLRLRPLLVEKLWGGRLLQEVLKKGRDDHRPHRDYGESWELSTLGRRTSVVQNGKMAGRSLSQLAKTYKEALLGEAAYRRFGESFPTLIKILHARENISLQVHPNDKVAKQQHGVAMGKSECWYVMDAAPGAKVITGFAQATSRTEYLRATQRGDLLPRLCYHEASPGDVFYIPAGQLHGTFGGEMLIAEVQQRADITYRVFDFHRKEHGNPRPLQTETAASVLNFHYSGATKVAYYAQENAFTPLIRCPHFSVDICYLRHEHLSSRALDLPHTADSFRFCLCVAGTCLLRYGGDAWRLQRGESLLLPACLRGCTLQGASSAGLLLCHVEEV